MSITRSFRYSPALGVLAGCLIAVSAALALPIWTVQRTPNRGGSGYTNDLFGVAATSNDNAWAVGDYIKGAVLGPIKKAGATKNHPWRPVIEHFNGKHWSIAQSPTPAGGYLQGVATTSSKNAWAVGWTKKGSKQVYRTRIERWDGTAWKTEASPNPGTGNDDELYGVSASSSNVAWAVGAYKKGAAYRTLVEQWNGKTWKARPSANASGATDNYLQAVAATSSDNAWAVGDSSSGTTTQTLIEHWNGKAWKVQPSPNPSGSSNNFFDGVVATSPKNAWAVGFYENGVLRDQTLVEHWNGKSWKIVPSVDPGGSSTDNLLLGVAATSRKNAWAVGWYFDGTQARTIVEHWTGTGWYIQPSADPGTKGDALYGVTAASANSALAVGERASSFIQRTLAEHGP